jgi:hypothetical protein
MIGLVFRMANYGLIRINFLMPRNSDRKNKTWIRLVDNHTDIRSGHIVEDYNSRNLVFLQPAGFT